MGEVIGNLTTYAKMFHGNSVNKGFYDKPVTALLLWVIAIFPDWEYLLGLDEDNAGREASMDY